MNSLAKAPPSSLALGRERSRRKKKLRITLISYAFMLPALAIIIVFVVYPIIYSLPLALFDYSGIGRTTFIGLENFRHAFNDKDFWLAMRNSAVFVVVVPILQLLSMMLAVLVNRKRPGITLFRVLYYIPVVTSMIAVSIIWSFLFDADGFLNNAMMGLGLIDRAVYFLDDARFAMPSLMFVTVWQGLGYYMMLYLAGLQSVPSNLVEASRIDGASNATAFFRITLPMLKPYIWFCSLFSILSALGVFDVAFAMTKGGPNKATLVMNLYTYQEAFHQFKFGYASAAGMVMSVVTTMFSMLIFMYGRRGGGMSYAD